MLHPKMKYIYCGIDSHKNSHTAVIINCFNEKLGEITFDNKPSKFNNLLLEVKKYTPKKISCVFGMEDIGLYGRQLTAFLLSKNNSVKHINATLTCNERKKYPILNKTDSVDSECLAKILLDNLDTLPNATSIDLNWTLTTLSRRRSHIVKTNVSCKNQLHNNLSQHYPSYRKFFRVFDCNTALAFWKKYPSPSILEGTTAEKLGEFLHIHSSGFFSTDKAKSILECIDKDGDTETLYQERRNLLIEINVSQIEQNKKEISKIDKEVSLILEEMGCTLQTMIGIDDVTAGAIIAETGDIQRFSTAAKFAKFAGISPVTYASGETSKNFANRNGNRVLYRIIHDLAARNISQGRNKDKPVNAIFFEYYQKKIAEGKTKKQALKCVMRRISNIIYGLMKNKTSYVHPKLEKIKP